MDFTFSCPRCGQIISAKEEQRGAAIVCLGCNSQVTVPARGAPPPLPETEQRSFAKSAVVFGLGVLSAIYLVNPTAGIVELIPDNFPIIGNLDEAAATLLILRCLSYFGIDLVGMIKPAKPAAKPEDEVK